MNDHMIHQQTMAVHQADHAAHTMMHQAQHDAAHQAHHDVAHQAAVSMATGVDAPASHIHQAGTDVSAGAQALVELGKVLLGLIRSLR